MICVGVGGWEGICAEGNFKMNNHCMTFNLRKKGYDIVLYLVGKPIPEIPVEKRSKTYALGIGSI